MRRTTGRRTACLRSRLKAAANSSACPAPGSVSAASLLSRRGPCGAGQQGPEHLLVRAEEVGGVVGR